MHFNDIARFDPRIGLAESLHDLVYSRPAPVWTILTPKPELLP
jgi:hypothetical protein